MKAVLKAAYRPVRSVLNRIRDAALRPESRYRAYLSRKFGVQFPPRHSLRWNESSGVLCRDAQWQQATDQLRAAGLPLHDDGPKNWDTLIALSEILSTTSPEAAILDAGAELYSALLPSLYAFGYRRLTGLNLAFPRLIERGPIRYEPGDITQTRFADASFDAITCLSVVEHGVPLGPFFAEMARLLKSGGALVVSTDYWQTPVDTGGQLAFGAPIHVFTQVELEAAIELASEHGLELSGPLDLECENRVVRWDYYGLDYTFVTLSFRRAAREDAPASAELQSTVVA